MTLSFDSGNVGQALGRFRLSATGSDRSARRGRRPRARRGALLAIAPGDAVARDSARPSDAEYRGQAAALKPARDRIAAHREGVASDLGIVTALVMQRAPDATIGRRRSFRERGAYLVAGRAGVRRHACVLPPMRRRPDAEPARAWRAGW